MSLKRAQKIFRFCPLSPKASTASTASCDRNRGFVNNHHMFLKVHGMFMWTEVRLGYLVLSKKLMQPSFSRSIHCNSPTYNTNEMEKATSKKLSEMTIEELREEVIRLQVTNENLVNTMKKSKEDNDPKWKQRSFNFKNSRKRHILLWISYLGWSFEGFVSQPNTSNTVEDILWRSLKKVNLVEGSKPENYSRCGRTDKGVSAFSQVISLDIRSIQPHDFSPLTTPELPYCAMLNRVFPPDLRAIAWKPATENYDARFECTKRAYKYFFPKGDYNIEAMQKACTFLEGTHDFRNLCKMDVANGIVNFVRTIEIAKIEQLEFQQDSANPEFNMYSLTIQSGGFLYHQIRCIMHILILIGEGNERPEVICELLDVENHPRKPQYSPAHELPLNLFSAEYPANGFEWVFGESNMEKLQKDFLYGWTLQACKTAMLRSIVHEVSNLNPVKSLQWQSNILKAGGKGQHHPLMNRVKGESLEEKIDNCVKKRKIKVVYNEDDEMRVVKLSKLKAELSEDARKVAMSELCSTIDNVAEKKKEECEDESINVNKA